MINSYGQSLDKHMDKITKRAYKTMLGGMCDSNIFKCAVLGFLR
jgi:hypothetical protein